MASFLRMLLNRGCGPAGPLLSEDSFTHLTRPAMRMDVTQPIDYAYGLVVREHAGQHYIIHGGGMPGFIAYMVGNLDTGLGAYAAVNGIGGARDVANVALDLVTAALQHQPLPDTPLIPDPHFVERAGDYAGRFISGNRTLSVVAGTERLWIDAGTEQIPLEAHGPDQFYANHPTFALFGLRAERAPDAPGEPGRVIAFSHGSDWYAAENIASAPVPATPPEWHAYVGHYRAHSPWSLNFRVVLRRGQLLLIFPEAPDGFDDEQPLVPLPDGSFRAGDDARGPERLQFDTIVDAQALRANLSGCACYRFFTP